MSLELWQQKISNKQKSFSFRDFILHVTSRRPLTFYKNNGVFSHFPPNSKIKTVDFTTFSQERGNYTVYGRNYNPEDDFFVQLASLSQVVPYPHIILTGECDNSAFASFLANCKNTYLSTTINGSENVFYSMVCRANSTDIYSSVFVINNCANVYQSSLVINSQNIFFSFNVDNCFDCWMCENIVGCQHCISCRDMENQSYCIENISYSKDDFLRLKDVYISIDLAKTTQTDRNISMGNANKLSTNLNNALYAYNTHTAQNVCFVG